MPSKWVYNLIIYFKNEDSKVNCGIKDYSEALISINVWTSKLVDTFVGLRNRYSQESGRKLFRLPPQHGFWTDRNFRCEYERECTIKKDAFLLKFETSLRWNIERCRFVFKLATKYSRSSNKKSVEIVAPHGDPKNSWNVQQDWRSLQIWRIKNSDVNKGAKNIAELAERS